LDPSYDSFRETQQTLREANKKKTSKIKRAGTTESATTPRTNDE
jgi:hypothetical protein